MQAVTQSKQEYSHVGDTLPVPNHVHDLIHDLSERIDAIWRYDQYIANAEGRQELQDCWKQIKEQDQQRVMKLKDLLMRELSSQDWQQGPAVGRRM